MSRLKSDTPSRSVNEVGRGDYVKIGAQWKRIESNSASGAERTPRNWTVTTEDGASYDMWSINRYAKAEDLD
jgi:hypothetical protein